MQKAQAGTLADLEVKQNKMAGQGLKAMQKAQTGAFCITFNLF